MRSATVLAVVAQVAWRKRIMLKIGRERSLLMNRNVLYLVICLLAIVVAVVGYLLYQERQSGIRIDIGESGVTIEGN
jgi:uncharacterized membrane protein YidH (DUF202 family)